MIVYRLFINHTIQTINVEGGHLATILILSHLKRPSNLQVLVFLNYHPYIDSYDPVRE